jgi:excisionase family DNA binding protein
VEKLLLTITEAAEAIGLGRSKVYELVAAGVIESVQIGRSRRIPVQAIHRYVDQLVAVASAPGA